MVTTSVASPAAITSWLVERDGRSETAERRERRERHGRQDRQAPVACTILTPSGALLARALVTPRPASLPDDAYALELSQVEPSGALEPLLRANPQVVLRMPHEAQLALRIDHIIGPRERRTYYLQTIE